jgi:3-methyladenine DNA glycosylase AlkD
MLKEIQSKILKSADPIAAESIERFFIEPVKSHGLNASEVKAISKQYLAQIDKMDKRDVFDLCDKLMKTDYMEEFGIANDFVHRMIKRFEKSDFAIFEKLVDKYVNNWAKCDMFCNHNMGDLIVKFPELAGDVVKWARSENCWVRRGAAVTFILPARHGLFHDEVLEIATILMRDPETLVRKGYGWALKAVGETDPKRVYAFISKYRTDMPRTAFRYAIEKFPKYLKKQAMALEYKKPPTAAF